VAVRLLSDDAMFWSMNREARQHQAGRNWAMAAEELEQALTEAGRIKGR
jgi:hypothetical protein